MSIAEKLIKVAENQQKVYDAGYQKGVSETDGYGVGYNDGQADFGIPNEVTGTGIVTLDYVNENEHNVEVKLYSDTVTDFSGVEVRQLGKNIWDKDYASDRNNWLDISIYPSIPIFVGKGSNVTISYPQTLPLGLEICFVITKDGAFGNHYKWLYHTGVEVYNNNEVTFIAENDYIYVNHFCNANAVFEDVMKYIGNELQIEISPIKTEYEPYTEKTYTANADGTVDGVTSISPTMNIICEGVDISAKYFMVVENMINAKELFEKNEISTIPKSVTEIADYSFSHTVFKKAVDFSNIERIGTMALQYATIPYGVTITNKTTYIGTDTLRYVKTPTFHLDTPLDIGQARNLGRENRELISVTFGENATTIPYGMCLGCDNLESVYIPNTIKNIDSYCFEACKNLKTINIPASIVSIGAPIFLSCTALEFVTIEQGFNANNLYLADSTLYSVETIVFWLEALADRTGLESYNLIIGTKNIEKLSEEQIAIATYKNWTLT